VNPRIVSLATAVPPHAIPQERAKEFSRVLFEQVLSEDRARLLSVFDHSGIACRNVCAPLEWYAADHSFGEKNARYVENAVALGAEVAEAAMAHAGLGVRDIDHLLFVSSTGIAAPSVAAQRRAPHADLGPGLRGRRRRSGAGARVRAGRSRLAGAAHRARAVQPHLPAQ
jgi:predicted naringenin-chalcone synthase